MDRNTLGYTIDAIIQGFEGTTALLQTVDHQVVRWPIQALPHDIEEGSPVLLCVSTDRTREEDREQLARDVLNTLLRG